MNCRHYKNDIFDAARERKKPDFELKEHLQKCPHCNEIFEAQQKLSGALLLLNRHDESVIETHAPSNHLLNALHAEKKTSFVRPSLSAWKLEATSVLVLALLFGSYWIYKSEYRQNERDQKTTSVRPDRMDDYVPLTYGMTPGESLQRIRVKLPRSALNDFGITLNQARSQEVTADVIVGESGIPYAIRVVQQ